MNSSIFSRLQRLEKSNRGCKPDDNDGFVNALGVGDAERYRLPDGSLDWLRALNDSAKEAWADYDLRKDD